MSARALGHVVVFMIFTYLSIPRAAQVVVAGEDAVGFDFSAKVDDGVFFLEVGFGLGDSSVVRLIGREGGREGGMVRDRRKGGRREKGEASARRKKEKKRLRNKRHNSPGKTDCVSH